ncbi:hypothetical protein N0V90_003644 [Kalmusia sp. IMI 367209]|nr:hypothetical protein N0V90_003644 [Kalmusia sp. IMI 367209]
MEDEKHDKLRGRWFIRARISAEEVVPSHDEFMREKLSKTGGLGSQQLCRIVKAKAHDKDTKSNTKEQSQEALIETLNAMPLESLSQYVRAESASLRTAKSDLDEKRTKGAHRAYVKTERFIVEFDRFLTAYSGIVNIIATADAQYGGIATATLALFFSAAQMKSKDEAAIVSAMGHMSDRLPDFSTYQKIYPDPELGEMLSDAYRDIILLAREATAYFQSSTFKMQERSDRTLVAGLREALRLNDYRCDEARKELLLYREYLEAKFDRDRHREKLRVSDFLAEGTCQCWTSDGSVVLVLSGLNDSGIASISESWLSPVAVDLTRGLLDNQRIVAFEMCDDKSTCEGVLARLIYQLLELNPRVVRKADDWQDLERHITGRRVDRLEGLKAALLKIVNLQREPVFIILDRPELNGDEDTGEYIKMMLSVAKETTGELKVLIVQRTELFDFAKNKHGIVPRGLDPKLLQTIRLDQRRIK